MSILTYLYIILIIVNIVCIVRGNKNKVVSFASLVFILLFTAGIEYNGSVVGYDLRNYEIMYNNTSLISNYEWGFKAVNDLGNIIGLDFYQFRFWIIMITLFSIFVVVYRMKGNLNLVIVAYLLYFLGPLSGQIKNICAVAVFVHIFPIPKSSSVRYTIKECLLIAVAASFHYSFYIYFVFLLINSRVLGSNKKNFYRWFFSIVTAYTVFCIIFKRFSLFSSVFNIVFSLSDSLNDIYSSRYSTVTGLSSMASVAILLLCAFGIIYWKKHFFSIPGNIASGRNEVLLDDYYKRTNISVNYRIRFGIKKFILSSEDTECVLDMVLLSSIFFPLVVLNATFYRLIRDVTLIGIMHLSINCNKYKTNVQKRFFLMWIVIGICIGWFIFDVAIKGYSEEFFKNYFINSILSF